MISVGLIGCDGRMGKRVVALMASEFQKRAELKALIDQNSSPGNQMGCAVVIDFSTPEAGANLASRISAARSGPALVIASTGWTADQRKQLEEASQFVPVLMSSNFSLGVMALHEIIKISAPLLDSLGYKPVITETHHHHKKDAPSGTAFALQRTIQQTLGSSSDIQTHSIRAGEIVGDHQISFFGSSDWIRIEHSAMDRDIFARGAIEAALWLAERRGKEPAFHGLIPTEVFFSDFKAAQASV
jgi:4-hydroxy-tetrahydrodipicolinate reductase